MITVNLVSSEINMCEGAKEWKKKTLAFAFEHINVQLYTNGELDFGIHEVDSLSPGTFLYALDGVGKRIRKYAPTAFKRGNRYPTGNGCSIIPIGTLVNIEENIKNAYKRFDASHTKLITALELQKDDLGNLLILEIRESNLCKNYDNNYEIKGRIKTKQILTAAVENLEKTIDYLKNKNESANQKKERLEKEKKANLEAFKKYIGEKK